MDPRLRQLKIRSGVVRRLAKERQVYAKEAEQQKERLEKSKQANADEYLLKKQQEVLQEALMMIPDCDRRLAKAQLELKDILESEQDLKETEEYIAANNALNDSYEQTKAEVVA